MFILRLKHQSTEKRSHPKSLMLSSSATESGEDCKNFNFFKKFAIKSDDAEMRDTLHPSTVRVAAPAGGDVPVLLLSVRQYCEKCSGDKITNHENLWKKMIKWAVGSE